MSYAIDLTPRQSSRIIEQALRHHAPVLLEPRVFNEEEALRGHLDAALPAGNSTLRPACVVVSLTSHYPPDAAAPPHPGVTLAELNLLVGTCCDACLRLSDARYLFDADVLRIEESHEPGVIARVYLTRPESLQVMQRRRFSRFRPGRSTQIELCWRDEENTLHGVTAWLCNISPDGLACRVERDVAEHLWIGDRIHAEFSLAPGELNRYTVDAVLCSKTPCGNPRPAAEPPPGETPAIFEAEAAASAPEESNKMILGLQYVTAVESQETARAANKLREHLQARLAGPARLPRGADA